jgi:hypothetical protein
MWGRAPCGAGRYFFGKMPVWLVLALKAPEDRYRHEPFCRIVFLAATARLCSFLTWSAPKTRAP